MGTDARQGWREEKGKMLAGWPAVESQEGHQQSQLCGRDPESLGSGHVREEEQRRKNEAAWRGEGWREEG